MIEKPCFFSTTETINISACTPSCVVFRVDKTMSWDACKHGKLHPFYPNWQRMTEQAAAGPWTNGTPTKEDKYLARWSDGSWGGAYWFGGEWMWDGRLSTSLDPIAFAEINTEGL